MGYRRDPHLHAHCLASNATYDAVEDKWKACQFGEIKRGREYYEAAFHARLSLKVGNLIYGVTRSGKWWEIEGVSRDVIDNFSQRTELIKDIAVRKGITNSSAKSQL